MNNLCISILLSILCIATSYSQESSGPIIMKKMLGGYQFSQGGDRLNFTQLARVVKPNPEAYKLAKSAKANNIYSSIIGGVGGFMLGWNIGTAIGGGNPNWLVAGAGASLIVIAIPISNSGMKQARRAAELYNDSAGYGILKNKQEWHLSLGSQGTGLVFKF